jgi:serine/threonine-protein kinase
VKDITVGEVVDRRYTLKREIASGGMGVVFEAQQAYTGRAVALKLPHRDHLGNARVGERLLREARALGAVKHPNVVEVIDAGIDPDGDVYIATEMLEGRTLEGILAARGELAALDVLLLARQLCDALAAIHARGVLHRDVKPGNVFITRDEHGSEVAKLIDFGIASLRVGEAPGGYGRLTAQGELLGTPEYMAPEQLLGLKDVDHRCDIYSLGVTLFEALTGELPFTGSAQELLATLATARQPPSLLSLRPLTPPRLAAAIERALAKDPAERFPDAASFARALGDMGEAAGHTTRLLSGAMGQAARRAPPARVEGDRHAVAAVPPLPQQPAVDPAQRRRYLRAPYVSPVRLLLADDTHLDGRAEDISLGGMLVIAAHPLPQESRVRVRFALPGHGAIATLTAVVRWNKHARAGRAAIGLEFTEVPDDARRAIAMFVTLTSAQAAE